LHEALSDVSGDHLRRLGQVSVVHVELSDVAGDLLGRF
jgi:hypothetical protein